MLPHMNLHSGRCSKLMTVQPGIESAARQQRLMIAILNNAPTVHDDDAISIANG